MDGFIGGKIEHLVTVDDFLAIVRCFTELKKVDVLCSLVCFLFCYVYM